MASLVFRPLARPALNRSYSTVQSASTSIATGALAAPWTSSTTPAVVKDATAAQAPRTSWTRDEVQQVYETPLSQLTHAAAIVHRRFHDPAAIQMCTLMNIKTGGCSEDCSYCAQSSRYSTGLKATKLSPVEDVLRAARIAKENGSTRFCMGAAWRDMRGRKTSLKNIKEMVTGVRSMGMEVCVTLGMIDSEQAKELKDAGLTAYNHNLDTSREYYPSIITSRSYDERLQTLSNVRDAGINVCSGGILGLGEADSDRIGLLHTVATLPSHPESFPVNALVPIKGTPLGDRKMISFDKLLRTIATARIVLPATIVRLAAGRINLSEEQQVSCFMAGANAVFTGEKMLTTDCNGWDQDHEMFQRWGFYPMKSFEDKGGKNEKSAMIPESDSELVAARL
ncbi:biotin synthase, putative [Talaromyces stipitatus ATCC 10500]|uniref:biotin synthase n=1 Tax=Talaromyces stipitatus (strain ATCC 10500 / CBS 375.48 / QM 6759 / NRRL 1006) TaxID=441959 RepID=B8M624_TALSN|nr:biotin synthase, putative [Talaromyces stipitatus ATCC 10500]EED19024.1 biotin synthase, putative [Talaromyces stipitatus ATCC 10500]